MRCYLPEGRVILKYVSASLSIMIQFVVLKKLNFFRAFHFVSVRVQTFCIFKFFYNQTHVQ